MDSVFKSLTLVFVFFLLTPVVIGASLLSLAALDEGGNSVVTGEVQGATSFIKSPKSGVSVYASLPLYQPVISGSATAADARPGIIKNYLLEYNSPIADYSHKIVEVADKYSLDFRLITAIAQQESNLCKRIPPGSHNCWGWGIHSEGSLGFDSYDEGIEAVSKGLRQNYLDKGYTEVDDIMRIYTPLSDGSWARGVKTFMADMQ